MFQKRLELQLFHKLQFTQIKGNQSNLKSHHILEKLETGNVDARVSGREF